MTTLHKAAQAALEALCLPCDRWNATQHKIVEKAIDDLRAALAQEPAQQEACELASQALAALEEHAKNHKLPDDQVYFHNRAVDELRKELAQEPAQQKTKQVLEKIEPLPAVQEPHRACQDRADLRAKYGHEIAALEAERDALKAALDHIDMDKGRTVLSMGTSWYFRKDYGMPFHRAKSLSAAIEAAVKAAKEQ